MEKSLLFFYSIIAAGFIYICFTLAKDKHKWRALGFILSLIISLVFASSFSSLSTGLWFLVVIVSLLVILFSSALLTIMVTRYSVVRHVNRKANQLKNLPPAAMLESLFDEQTKHQWYVFYLPLKGLIEIGMSLYGETPVAGKKFCVKTLSGRNMYFTPDIFNKKIDLKTNAIHFLRDFYKINDQTRTVVDNYMLKIKDGHKEPWLLDEDINKP